MEEFGFGDGNERAARLLMNLLLVRGGYPPVAAQPQDRKTYLDALERGSLAGDLRPFQNFMHEWLDATLAEYLRALQEALPRPNKPPNLPPKKQTPRGRACAGRII